MALETSDNEWRLKAYRICTIYLDNQAWQNIVDLNDPFDQDLHYLPFREYISDITQCCQLIYNN